MKLFFSNNTSHLKKESGAVLIFVVGLIVVITIIMALTLNWYTNLSRNQLRINEQELKEIEPHNVDRIIHAIVRKRMMDMDEMTNMIISSADSDLISENLTRSSRGIDTNTETLPRGFEWAGGTFPTIPLTLWFTTNIFTSKNPSPKPSNPLFYLWNAPHDLTATNTNSGVFDGVETELRLWQNNPPTDAAERANVQNYLPTFTNVTKLHLREIPSSQIQLTSVDKFNAPKCDININITNGVAFFPYGIVGGASEHNCSIIANHVVAHEDWRKNGEASALVASPYTYFSPGLAATWFMEPYLLTEENSDNDYAPQVASHQKYFPKSQRIVYRGGDNSTLSPSDDPAVQKGAIKAERYGGGMYRVVMRVDQLSENNAYYIECTTPLAKQRGVVVVGTGGNANMAVSIVTNGALRLSGEQSASDLVLGTSYGGVVFTDTASHPSGYVHTWRAYLCTPVRPPVVLASSKLASSFPQQSYTIDDLSSAIGGAATLALPNQGLNYDTIQLSGTVNTGGTKVGFGWHADLASPGNPTSCYVQFTAGSAQHVYAYLRKNTSPTAEGPSFNIPNGNVDFEITYHRALNFMSLRVKSTGASDWTSVDIPFNTIPPRFEVNNAAWSAPIQSMTITTRSGGSALYKEGTVNGVTLQGGLLVGSIVTGSNFEGGFTIQPVPDNQTDTSVFSLCDRILIMDP